MQKLNTLLASADMFAPDAPLYPEWVLRRRPQSMKLAFGGALMLLLVAVLLVLPTWNRSPTNMAVAIADAVSEANTWHLSGWKQSDGKRVPWDIWGRRRPFLFYEKIGGDITVDDGTKRLRLYPPNPTLDRPVGLVIRTASERADFDGYGPSPTSMVSLWNWGVAGGGVFAPKPFKQTPARAFFRLQYPLGLSDGVNSNSLYTISKRSWLPVQYRLHYDSARFQRDTELLDAHYDVRLPKEVTSPDIPVTYQAADFTGGRTQALRLTAELRDMDKAGNLLVSVQGRLGAVPITPQSIFTLSASSVDAHIYRQQGAHEDEYLAMEVQGFSYTSPGGEVLQWLARREPSSKINAVASRLHLGVHASLNVQVPATDIIGSQGQAMPTSNSLPLFSKDVTYNLPLPLLPTVASVPQSRAWPVQWTRSYPLDYYVDQVRASQAYLDTGFYYQAWKRVAPDLVKAGLFKKTGLVNAALMTPQIVKRTDALYQEHRKVFDQEQQKQRRQAAYWEAQVVDSIPNTNKQRFFRLAQTQTLAKYQQDAGEAARSKQTLRRLIKDCDKLPQRGGLLRRQSEYMLQTGQFLTDANYKGPT